MYKILCFIESCSGSRSISNGLYEITYSVEGDNIDFTISASTIGWVGLGFSANQFMVSVTDNTSSLTTFQVCKGELVHRSCEQWKESNMVHLTFKIN